MQQLRFIPINRADLPAVVAEPLHDRWAVKYLTADGKETIIASGMPRKEATIAAVTILDDEVEYEVWACE